MEQSLQQWMSKSQEGDKRAFENLFNATSPRLLGMLVKMLKSKSVAEEVLQESFVEVWKNASRYSVERGSVMSWIFGIVRYRALDRLRAEKKHALSASDVEPSFEVDMAYQLDSQKRFVSLKHCFEKLPADQQQSIQAAFYEGLTHEEISDRLTKPLGSVKTWIRRGLSQLKSCLEPA